MELLLTEQDLEPLPEPKNFIAHTKPEGILNSNYKKLARKNLGHITSQSLFGIKQRLKYSKYRFTSATETLLKVSVFTGIIITIFS
ncbi:hypothetical protein Q4Q39_17065 [Flavivirga amylovorans]|uniref:Transposase DDE domain-containing protein n=1 Tax=Flavivirga amylovorans TaxID=870486 RepID=A0ABT8X552_9FLAO|nr:hypothetical protein [Flavivirga amylovorans]MDO5989118.1 hypothetical protein [Flavivirga amylovorans]